MNDLTKDAEIEKTGLSKQSGEDTVSDALLAPPSMEFLAVWHGVMIAAAGLGILLFKVLGILSPQTSLNLLVPTALCIFLFSPLWDRLGTVRLRRFRRRIARKLLLV